MILEWKKVAEEIKGDLKNYLSEKWLNNKYVSIFLLWENKPSEVYVKMKKKFWNDIWIDVKIFWSKLFSNNQSESTEKISKLDLLKIETLLESIDILNKDEDCVWIVVQLPLPENLQEHKSKILAKISPLKDIDWLWWALMWISTIDFIDFLPATPASVITLLEYYNLADFSWKKVTIIWQSNLVWKPLVMEIIKRYWEVFSFNHRWNKEDIKESCKKSDYIISATWSINMINWEYLWEGKNQILVDVWYWILNWKAVWDIDYNDVKWKIKAITPVPGWVWPLTVACLFNNIKVINEQKIKLKGILF